MQSRVRKVVLITGAGSGIGAATARRLADEGHQIVLADIDAERVRNVAADVGHEALAVPLDIRSVEQWNTTLDLVWSRFGRLDVLINNAGIIHTGYVRDVSIDEHRRTLEVNYLGPLIGMKQTLPRFQAQGSGHFVTVCSMTAFLPMPGMASYAGTKHALRAFHHTLALEERKGPLKFSIVHPPSTETGMLEQELSDDSTALAFSEKSVSADFVASKITQAVHDQPSEVVMPAGFGQFLRLFGATTGIMRLMVDHAEAKGRRVQAALRKKRHG
ncbi:3alpha(or 20beta)-hydroxysteroid dehydrogenase [Rhodanobacter sp. K2T2]|uniref:SDR family oxidoreductase n=1 Tax=Rhodanobacter sp. K2T2 TaxID=2723085 RepID=UPI0017FC0ADB|nr:SDR family oxidoreductase [Rhodanobacter sp. K2T2]NYE30790.1 3alpha(or 20beta)-hydroxysteroid dehydrogenase [Rhodanobacter sp. K2T2]